MAAAGLATAAAAAVAFVAITTKEFAVFERAMKKSLAIMGEVPPALERDMVNAAKKMGRQSRFSATQAAESFFFLASAGLDAKSSLLSLPVVMKFARAGAFDMARATDILTDAQSALGLTIRDDAVKNMENMIHLSDVLVKANTLANASVEQFSEALQNKFGARLRVLNKDVEEGAAAMAVMADQGIKASIAGERGNILFRDLAASAAQNEAAFRKWGVEVFDNRGEMVNFADIVEDLTDAMGHLGAEQKAQIFKELGLNRRAQDTVTTYIGMADALRKYEKALRDAGGTTEKVAAIQGATLVGQTKRLLGNLQSISITWGQAFGGPVLDVLTDVNTILDKMNVNMETWFNNPVLRWLMRGEPRSDEVADAAERLGYASRREGSDSGDTFDEQRAKALGNTARSIISIRKMFAEFKMGDEIFAYVEGLERARRISSEMPPLILEWSGAVTDVRDSMTKFDDSIDKAINTLGTRKFNPQVELKGGVFTSLDGSDSARARTERMLAEAIGREQAAIADARLKARVAAGQEEVTTLIAVYQREADALSAGDEARIGILQDIARLRVQYAVQQEQEEKAAHEKARARQFETIEWVKKWKQTQVDAQNELIAATQRRYNFEIETGNVSLEEALRNAQLTTAATLANTDERLVAEQTLFDVQRRLTQQRTSLAQKMFATNRAGALAMLQEWRDALVEMDNAPVLVAQMDATIEEGEKAAEGHVPNFHNIGTQFASGLAQGTIDAKSLFKQALSTLINFGLSYLTGGLLKIGSPSRVTMEIGKYVTMGLAEGILSGKQQVADAFAEVIAPITAGPLDIGVPGGMAGVRGGQRQPGGVARDPAGVLRRHAAASQDAPADQFGINIDFSSLPPARDPLSSARDRDWMELWMETGRQASKNGFRVQRF